MVLNKDMTTSKNASSANGALWTIAFTLAIIAICLVALVVRQENRAKVETVEAPGIAPPADTLSSAHKPPHALSSGAINRRPQTRAAAETPPLASEAVPAPETRSEAALVIKPVVSGGLAPLTALAATNGIATIDGRVILKGTPPPETPIVFGPQCGQPTGNSNTTRRYLVSSDGGLANVFVYIKSGLKETKFPTPSEPVLLNQAGCIYEPYVFGLMVNQKLRIKNSDDILHNVHAMTPNGDSDFNLAEGPGMIIEKSFRTAGIPVRLGCDVHPWMFAYACVVENPYFAVTDANGNYSISNVPPGDYVLEAYHVKTHGHHDGETQQIATVAGETTTANFTIELTPGNGSIAKRQ